MSCLLVSNLSVPYQDFLVHDIPQSLMGIQITLSKWKGAGAGLHLLQLLSSSVFASAVKSQNGPSCFMPASSNVTLSGDWMTIEVTTTITGRSMCKQHQPLQSSPCMTSQFYAMPCGMDLILISEQVHLDKQAYQGTGTRRRSRFNAEAIYSNKNDVHLLLLIINAIS